MKHWQEYGRQGTRESSALEGKYALLGALYTGTWTADPRWPWGDLPVEVYKNARQVTKHTGSIVDLYEQLVWTGPIPTNVESFLEDRGALPFSPQTGKDDLESEGSAGSQLVQAFLQLCQMWAWRSQMSLIPKTAAIFGDVLVELVNEPAKVMPHIVFPGFVPDEDLELDLAGNVQRYAVEWQVTVIGRNAFGKEIQGETYRFRKEVDPESIRYYKDGKEFAYPEHGPAVQRNPYGFAPAVWFRHEVAVGTNRGLGAYEKSVVQMLELNSTLSSATDYQRKIFGAPIGIKGRYTGSKNRTITMPLGLEIGASYTEATIQAVKRAAAENINLLGMSPDADFVTIPFDIGQTMAMVEFAHSKIVSENPEAEWADKLMGLSQVTGPGADKLLSPISGKVVGSRTNHDPRMVQLLQQGTAIMGHMLDMGVIPPEVRASRADRYAAFEPFDLASYGRGLLDATIQDRPVFPESDMERAQWLTLADGLQNEWALRRMGITEDEIEAAMELQEQKRMEMEERLTGIRPGSGEEEDEDIAPEGPSGPTGPTGVTG